MAAHGKRITDALKKTKLSNDLYEIRCLKCDAFAVMSNNVRKIENSHHVVIDPSIDGRVEIRPYPKTYVISPTFECSGKIYCKGCNSDWGIMALHRGVPFPIIKICSFIVKCESQRTQTSYKKWKDVPFMVAPLIAEEVSEVANRNIQLYGAWIPKNRATDEDDEDNLGQNLDSDTSFEDD